MNPTTTEHRFRISTLIIGDGTQPLEDVIVTTNGERIVGISPARGDEPVEGLTDLRGHSVIPGLIDTHVHLGYDGGPHGQDQVFQRMALPSAAAIRALAQAQSHLHAGFTTIRVLGCSDHVDIAVRDAVDRGLFAGPRIFAAGHALGTTGGHMDQAQRLDDRSPSWIFDSPDEARRAARHQVKMGVDCIKLASDGLQWHPRQGGRIPRGPYREMSFEELRAVCEVAEWADIHVAVHTDGGSAMRDAVRAGARTIEHIKDLSEDDVRFLADSEAFLTPTMVATANTLAAGEAGSGLNPVRYAFFVRQWDAKRRSFERALRAGVRMVVGTDAGYAMCRHGDSARELTEFVRNGMTPLQAISAATLVAADAIGQVDNIGSIAAGKLADFVVVRGDPTREIGILEDADAIVAVYKGGVQVR